MTQALKGLNVPRKFFCPITRNLLSQPVKLISYIGSRKIEHNAHVFSKKALLDWLSGTGKIKSGKYRHPSTNEIIDGYEIIPETTIEHEIIEYAAKICPDLAQSKESKEHYEKVNDDIRDLTEYYEAYCKTHKNSPYTKFITPVMQKATQIPVDATNGWINDVEGANPCSCIDDIVKKSHQSANNIGRLSKKRIANGEDSEVVISETQDAINTLDNITTQSTIIVEDTWKLSRSICLGLGLAAGLVGGGGVAVKLGAAAFLSKTAAATTVAAKLGLSATAVTTGGIIVVCGLVGLAIGFLCYKLVKHCN